MIDYVQFGTHAWKNIVDRNALANGHGPSTESLNFFRYQLNRWHNGLSPEVQFDAAIIESDSASFFAGENELQIYLKTLLYLRSNQIQIMVLRPILVYYNVAHNNPLLVYDVVTIARKTIQTLSSFANKTALYVSRYTIFNHFLSSSLTVLFLAIVHEVEKHAANHTTAPNQSYPLAEIARSISEGLSVIHRYRFVSQSSARLWAFFGRPRQQLLRLGILSAQNTNPLDIKGAHDKPAAPANQDGSPSVQIHPMHGVQDGDAGIDSFSPADMNLVININNLFGPDCLNNGAFSLDWSEEAFPDPSGSFGLPQWM